MEIEFYNIFTTVLLILILKFLKFYLNFKILSSYEISLDLLDGTYHSPKIRNQ